MTNAQWKVNSDKMTSESSWGYRGFRKKCVEQGIVEFVKDFNFYELQYRGKHVCYLFGNSGEEKIKLQAIWSIIKIAEEVIRKIEGEKHESK